MAAFSVILAAAGQSRRFNNPDIKKTFVNLKDRAVWSYSARQFRSRSDVKQILIVLSPDDIDHFASTFRADIVDLQIELIAGGKERADSVQNGLKSVSNECDFVAIHDAARPCIDADLIERVFSKAEETGAAIPVTPVHSTVKKSIDGKTVLETMDRSQLFLAQTPQVFRKDLILDAYMRRGGEAVTDESQLLERFGHAITMVDGSPFNLKITTLSDLVLAGSYLDQLSGTKFDATTDVNRRWS